MAKEFKAFNHGTGPIVLAQHNNNLVMQAKPTELHLKENGTLNNGPSFAIVMEDYYRNRIIGQVSLDMLKEALNEIGYDIVKL